MSFQRSPSHTDADTFPASVPVTVGLVIGESWTTASTRVPDDGPTGESLQAVVVKAIVRAAPAMRILIL
jgi:hypothetical protein